MIMEVHGSGRNNSKKQAVSVSSVGSYKAALDGYVKKDCVGNYRKKILKLKLKFFKKCWLRKVKKNSLTDELIK